MTQIVVKSRTQAKQFGNEVVGDWVAVSVSTETCDFVQLEGETLKEVLQLCFWDIANPTEERLRTMDGKLFCQGQAQQIIDFVDRWWGNVDWILVHCEAGRSRSPAIAAAIDYIWNGREASLPYFQQYDPNHFVFKTMLETKFGPHSEMSNDAKVISSQRAYDKVPDDIPLEIIE